MIKKINKIMLQMIFMVCLLISSFYVPKVEAKTLGQLKDELEDLKAEYEENQLQQELNEEELAKTKNRITQIRQNMTNIEDNIHDLGIQIEELDQSILEKQQEIEDILVFFQLANGESAYLEYAFGAKDFTDFIYRLAVSEQLTSYNEELVDQFKKDIEESKKKTQELEQEKESLKKEQKDLQSELVKINNKLEELDDDAFSIEEQLEAMEAEIELYSDKGCKDDEDIRVCGKNILPPDTSMWRPVVTGYISGYSGWRIDPFNGSSDFHHGLDISASAANTTDYPIYPIANGMVVYVEKSNPHGCGGNKVYIQHNINGQIYTSGYWHLRRVLVNQGDTVTKSTQIAVMGGNPDTEYWDTCTTGAHLHLELSNKVFSDGIYALRAGFLRPELYINFPSKGVYWYDKTTQY